jgi:hypothetical protein
MTIAAIIDNRTTPLFIAAIRVLIEQRGCTSAAFLSRERDFRNGSKGEVPDPIVHVRFDPDSGSCPHGVMAMPALAPARDAIIDDEAVLPNTFEHSRISSAAYPAMTEEIALLEGDTGRTS